MDTTTWEQKLPSKVKPDTKPKLLRRNPEKEIVNRDQKKEADNVYAIDKGKWENLSNEMKEEVKVDIVKYNNSESVGHDEVIDDANVQSYSKKCQEDNDVKEDSGNNIDSLKKNIPENLPAIAPQTTPEIPGLSFIIGIKADDETSSKKLLYHCVICHEGDDTITFLGSAMKKHSHSRTHLLNVMRAECHAMYEKFVDDHQTPAIALLKELIDYQSELQPQKILIVRRKNYCRHREKVILKMKELLNKANPITTKLNFQDSENRCKVYIGRISPDTTQRAIQEYFEQFGKVIKLDVKRNRGIPFNYGFIVFSCATMVDEVLKHAPHCIDGYVLIIERYGEKSEAHRIVGQCHADFDKEGIHSGENHLHTLYVGPLDYRITIECVKSYLETFGEIVNAHFNKSRNVGSLDKLFGFITFTNPVMVDKVLQHGPHQINGIPIPIVRYMTKNLINQEKSGHAIKEYNDTKSDTIVQELREEENINKLFVGPFDISLNLERLKSYLCQFGNIISTYFNKSKKHKTKRTSDMLFGFITFANAGMIENILRNGPHKIDGISVRMERYLKRTLPSEPSGPANNSLQFCKEGKNENVRNDLSLTPHQGELYQKLEKHEDNKLSFSKEFSSSVENMKECYQQNLLEIMKLQHRRMQRNIVIVTDERDNFDVTLTGFDRRVTVMRIPGLKFINAFSAIRKHSSFGQGSIFVYSGGTHDLVHSAPLQDCVESSHCPSLKTMLTLSPCVQDSHFLIAKALELNMEILSSTPNDVILFSVILPILVNKFNMASLRGRNCALHHLVKPIPIVNVDAYMQAVDCYNEFIKFHSQTLGYPTWNLTTPCFNDNNQNVSNRLLPDGYNICPEEEFKRANIAKNICTELLRISTLNYVALIDIHQEPLIKHMNSKNTTSLQKDNNAQEGLLKDFSSHELHLKQVGSQGGHLEQLSSQKGLLNEPSSRKGLLNEPSSRKGLLNIPSSQKGLLNEPSSRKGLLNEPSSWKGLLNEPSSQKGLLNIPSSQKGSLKEPGSQKEPLLRLYGQNEPLLRLYGQNEPLLILNSPKEPMKRISSQERSLKELISQEGPLKGDSGLFEDPDMQKGLLKGIYMQEGRSSRGGHLERHSSQKDPLNESNSRKGLLEEPNSQKGPLIRRNIQKGPMKEFNSQKGLLEGPSSQKGPWKEFSSHDITLKGHIQKEGFSGKKELFEGPDMQEGLLKGINRQEGCSTQGGRLKRLCSQKGPLYEPSIQKGLLEEPNSEQGPLIRRNIQKGPIKFNSQIGLVEGLSRKDGFLIGLKRQEELGSQKEYLEVASGHKMTLERGSCQVLSERLSSQKVFLQEVSNQEGLLEGLNRQEGLLKGFTSQERRLESVMAPKWQKTSASDSNHLVKKIVSSFTNNDLKASELIEMKKEPPDLKPKTKSEIDTSRAEMSSTKQEKERSADEVFGRIKSLYENEVKEIVQMLKDRVQSHIVIITDERDNLDVHLDGFSSQVDVMKSPDLKFDNAFTSIKQHPRFGRGTIFVLFCGSLDVLLSIPLHDCLGFKCDRPQTMLTVSPCASDMHYLIRKALEVNMNILHSTENDVALFCGVMPIDVKEHNSQMLGNRPCLSNHPATKIPTVGFTSFLNYNDAIECYNSFTNYHAQSLGFSTWDLEDSVIPKKGAEGPSRLNRHKVCPKEEAKRFEKVKLLCEELLRKMSSSSKPFFGKEEPIEHKLINNKNYPDNDRQTGEDRPLPDEFADIKGEESYHRQPEIKQQATCDNELLEKVKALYNNNMVKIITMRQNRSPNKICLVTDEREHFDVSLAGFDERVDFLKVSGMKLGTVWSLIKSHTSYGKGTNFVFCGGNHDLVYSVPLPDCLGCKCQCLQNVMTFRPCIKDTHYLIKKSLQLHMNVLLDTRNDTVSFCGLIPVSLNQYNFHTISKRPCSVNHNVKEIPAVNAMSVCNYNDVVDWFNAFTKYHSKMLNYPPWDLEKRHFDKNGPGETLSTNLFDYSMKEESERIEQVKLLCRELLPKSSSSEPPIVEKNFIPSTKTAYTSTPKTTSEPVKTVGQLQSTNIVFKSPARPIVVSSSNFGEKKVLKPSNKHLESVKTTSLNAKPPSVDAKPKNVPIAVIKQQPIENEARKFLSQIAALKSEDKTCPPKYSKKQLEKVSDRYHNSVQKIVEMHKDRTQNSVVLVTDERDNFDVSFVGFSDRVEVLKIPGMQFTSLFDILKGHRSFGKGTIFVFSGGTHDVLVPVALQDCLVHRCTRPQAVMTLPPASSDPHFLVEKVLKLNLEILRATKNDIALFSGLLPILINKYNNFYLNSRPCFLDHPAWQLPNISLTVDNNYKCLLSWYNEFTKLHAQSLGYEPWDLEAVYIDKVTDVLLANGYNLTPNDEWQRNKQAKSLCDGLLLKLTEVDSKVAPSATAALTTAQVMDSSSDSATRPPTTKASAVSNTQHTPPHTQLTKSPLKSPPDNKALNSNEAINKIIDITNDAVRTRIDEEIDEVITFSKNILNAIDVDDEASSVAFENVFFIGKRDIISPLFGCNLKSRMIYHELTSFEDDDMMTLLSKIGDFPEKSVCCLAFDLSIITKKLVVSPTCLQQSCQQPLFVTALRTSSVNSIQAMKEVNQFIYDHLRSISKFVTKLSQLCIPIIILPLAPERIYCDEGAPEKHRLSHEFANLSSCVVANGSKDLWTEASLSLIQCWNNLMETHNKNYDPSKCISNYIQNNPSTFIILDDLDDYVTHWKAPRFWKAFMELYLSSVTNKRQIDTEEADLLDKTCDGVVISKVSTSIPFEFFDELFHSIDRDVHIVREKNQFTLKGMSLRRAYLLSKLNHFRLGDMILLISIVNKPANVSLEMNLMENLYISCIFERVYRKWKAQIIANLTNIINQEPNVASYKSELCKEGSRCSEFIRCLRYHSQLDKRRNPFLNKYSSTMCTMVKNSEGVCREGVQCRNAHNVYEAKFHPSTYQNKTCPSGMLSDACNRLKRCEFAHKDSPEMFFTAEWNDLVAVGANQALRFFSGAIRGIPKVQDLSRFNMRVLFISPSSEFLDVALRATDVLVKVLGLSTCMLSKDTDDLGSSQILLGAPSSFLNLDTRVFIQMRGAIIIDDIQRILENEHLRNDLSKMLNLITASSYNVVLNKVFISAGYDSKLASDISELAGLQPKQLRVLAEQDLALSDVRRTSPKCNISQKSLDRESRSKSRSLSRSRRSESVNKDQRSSRSKSASRGKRSKSRSRSRSRGKRSRSRSRSRTRSLRRNKRSRSTSVRRSKRSRPRSRSGSRSRFHRHSRYYRRTRSINRSRSRSRSVKRKRRSRSNSRNRRKSSEKNSSSGSANQRRSSLPSGSQDEGLKSGSRSPAKMSKSEAPSHAKKFVTAGQAVIEKELPLPSMEVQNNLRKRIGAKQFEEYLLTLETLRHDFAEEYLVYRDMPELYPEYAHHYDIFSALFAAQRGDCDEQRKESLWRVFWKSKYEDIRVDDWRTKLGNLTEEFERRVARSASSPDLDSSLIFEKAFSLLEGLCDEKIFYLAPGLRSLIEMCRERGTSTKEASELVTEADNVALLNIALEKFKTLSISSVPEDSRRMYERAVEWIPKLLAEAERVHSQQIVKESSTIDLESIARFSLGKAPEVTLNLIKTALAYEGTSSPPIEVINELFLKVCKIHFTLSMGE